MLPNSNGHANKIMLTHHENAIPGENNCFQLKVLAPFKKII